MGPQSLKCLLPGPSQKAQAETANDGVRAGATEGHGGPGRAQEFGLHPGGLKGPLTGLQEIKWSLLADAVHAPSLVPCHASYLDKAASCRGLKVHLRTVCGWHCKPILPASRTPPGVPLPGGQTGRSPVPQPAPLPALPTGLSTEASRTAASFSSSFSSSFPSPPPTQR